MGGSWKPTEIEEGTKRILICEGLHDKSVLEVLIEKNNLPDFKIFDAYSCCKKSGKDGLAPALEGLYPLTHFDELIGVGIVMDNDNERALTDLQKDLESLENFKSSQSPRIGKMGDIAVSTYLIPDHNTHGNLEELCLPALYDKWPDAQKCVEEYLNCTGAINWGKHKLSKAQVRCIISGFYKRKPERGLGHLFEAEKTLAEHKCFDDLANTLRRFDKIVERGVF